MTKGYQIIDRKTWKRAMHCQIFRNSLEPQYCISLELDITNFLNGRVILPFSVQVHHSFVDGIHVGKLVEKLQDYLNHC